MAGRAVAAAEFVRGFAAGAMQQPLPDDASEHFGDGWAEGRITAKEALNQYLNRSGWDSLQDVTIQQLLE